MNGKRSRIFATSLQKLIKISTYKALTAALLLVLYFFIITPIQLWHNHSYSAKKEVAKELNNKTNTTVLSAVEQETKSCCTACSHHYSVYTDVASIILDAPSIVFPAKKINCDYTIPSATLLAYSNKGPPASA